MPRPVDFWFDFASTYSYLSAMRIEAEAEKRGVLVNWRPFLLGPIFTAQGWNTSPFAIYPAKGRNMWRDMQRRADKYGLAFHRPDADQMAAFPSHSVLAGRCGLVALDEDWGKKFCRSVFEAQFAHAADIADPVTIGDLIDAAGGVSQTVLFSAHARGTKDMLRANVEEAKSLGIFGAPSFTVDGELFWGDDRLEDALDWAQR